MKFSIVLSTQATSFSALAYKGEIESNLAKIKKLDFDAVELAVRDPSLLDHDFILAALNNNKLIVSAIGTGQIFVEEGLSFTDKNSKTRFKTIERIKSHAELAGKLKTMVIIGLARGRIKKNENSEQAGLWLVEGLRECSGQFPDIKFAIEPINRYETNIINNVKEGLDFLEKLDRQNVGLLLDTFHMNIEEPSILESIKNAKEKLFHFHVADSNRLYPGAGHIDFKSILLILKEIGYSGYISAEIMPLPDPDFAAEKTIVYLNKLRQNLNE